MQLCFDGGIAVALDDGGSEEGISVGGHDHSEVHETAENDFVVFEYAPDVTECDLALGCGAALIGS